MIFFVRFEGYLSVWSYLNIRKMYAVKRTYRRNNSESVCRLCSSNSGIIVLNIFDDEGKKRRILSLINACLPVKVR